MQDKRKVMFPVTIKKGHTYFSDACQLPFLWHGDTCWSLFWEYTFEDACAYLDNRSDLGFTVIQVQLIPRRFYQANRLGQRPFLVDGDITSFNDDYFNHVEKVINYGRELGIGFAISPMWLSSWEQVWYRYFSGPVAETYSSFVAHRFREFDNILAWIHGGDDDALPLHEDIKACAMIYKEVTPNIANTFHAGIGGGWTFFGREPWFDFGMAYAYQSNETYNQFRNFKQEYPDKPILLGETHYEGNEGIGTEVIRHYAYQSLILGACGQTYGHKDIWMGTMFWELALCSQASHHMAMARDIWENFDWWQFKADLAGTELITRRSKMPNASSQPLAVAIHEEKGELLAYLDDYRWFSPKRTVQSGYWIDPITGRQRKLKWIGDKHDVLQIPGKNAAGGQDWLLFLNFAKEEI